MVDIVFINNGTDADPLWCPHRQLESCPQTVNGGQVRWRAVKEDGGGATQPLKTMFTIFYSPFPNGKIEAGNNGQTGYRPLNQNAPAGLYKYTVEPQTVNSNCKALDPNFWVNSN